MFINTADSYDTFENKRAKLELENVSECISLENLESMVMSAKTPFRNGCLSKTSVKYEASVES
jgi:hypothetical protein